MYVAQFRARYAFSLYAALPVARYRSALTAPKRDVWLPMVFMYQYCSLIGMAPYCAVPPKCVSTQLAIPCAHATAFGDSAGCSKRRRAKLPGLSWFWFSPKLVDQG